MRSAPRLVWITDRKRAALPLPELARRLARAGVEAVQVREPDLSDGALFELVSAVVEALAGSSARVLVNDRVDLALAAGAGGVQLKSDGLAVEQARRMARESLGAAAGDFLVGRSCHGAEELAAAAREGADLVCLSPLNESPGKRPLGPEGFRSALERGRGLAGGRALPAWLALGGAGPEDLKLLAPMAAAGERWGLAAVRALQGEQAENFAARCARALRSLP